MNGLVFLLGEGTVGCQYSKARRESKTLKVQKAMNTIIGGGIMYQRPQSKVKLRSYRSFVYLCYAAFPKFLVPPRCKGEHHEWSIVQISYKLQQPVLCKAAGVDAPGSAFCLTTNQLADRTSRYFETLFVRSTSCLYTSPSGY